MRPTPAATAAPARLNEEPPPEPEELDDDAAALDEEGLVAGGERRVAIHVYRLPTTVVPAAI